MNISVVIPLYNKEKTIIRALESILKQSVLPKEIIIVDDGSTDNSLHLVSDFNHHLIKVVEQKNSGVSSARNKGVEVSSFEWVAFLDADDEWKEYFLVNIFEVYERHPGVSIIATAFQIQADNLTTSIELKNIQFEKLGVMDNYFEVSASSPFPIHPSSIVVLKSALLSVGGFPEGIISGEDLLTWARLASKFKIGYHLSPSSIFHVASDEYKNAPTRSPDISNEVGIALEKIFIDNPGIIGLKQYIGLWYKMRASIYLRFGEDMHAFNSIKTSLRWAFDFKLLLYFPLLILPLSFRLKMFSANKRLKAKDGR